MQPAPPRGTEPSWRTELVALGFALDEPLTRTPERVRPGRRWRASLAGDSLTVRLRLSRTLGTVSVHRLALDEELLRRHRGAGASLVRVDDGEDEHLIPPVAYRH